MSNRWSCGLNRTSVVLSVYQSVVLSASQVLELRLVSIRVLCPVTMWASYMLQLKQNIPGQLDSLLVDVLNGGEVPLQVTKHIAAMLASC